jgi:hypothetical protein
MFDGVSARYNIPIIQFNLLARNRIKLNTMYDINIRSVVGNNYKPNGHPSEQGHRNISDFLGGIIDIEI